MDCGGGYHYYGRLGLRMAVLLRDKVRACGLGLRLRLNTIALLVTHSAAESIYAAGDAM